MYKQKVKHLLYEHQNNITTLKADGELALKLQQDEFRKREGELGRDKVGGCDVTLASAWCRVWGAGSMPACHRPRLSAQQVECVLHCNN